MSMSRGREWSEVPFSASKTQGRFPHNTHESRRTVTGVPASMQSWTFATVPPELLEDEEHIRIYEQVREWASTPNPTHPGLIITGPPGVGKSGLAMAAVTARAVMGDGDHAVWNLITAPSFIEAVAQSDLRARPAPCHYTIWSDLCRLLTMAERFGPPVWREDPLFCSSKILGELESQTSLLAIDEITREHATVRLTGDQYSLLHDWYNDLFVDKRLIIVAQHRLHSPEFAQAVSQSMVNRFSDTSKFLHLDFPFPSER
jgi:DNA polymerase III delta prime subunit